MTNYDDKILEFTPEWISTNDLIRKIRGNKTLILKSIKNNQFIDSRRKGNKIEYKRNDNSENELGFLGTMKVFEWNQKVELDKIKRLDTIIEIDNKLTEDGKDLLDHVQDQVDRSYTVIIRMNYQAHLKVIPQRTANERTKQLQDHIDKIMKALMSKYDNDLIKNYFQNHVKRLEFKI